MSCSSASVFNETLVFWLLSFWAEKGGRNVFEINAAQNYMQEQVWLIRIIAISKVQVIRYSSSLYQAAINGNIVAATMETWKVAVDFDCVIEKLLFNIVHKKNNFFYP